MYFLLAFSNIFGWKVQASNRVKIKKVKNTLASYSTMEWHHELVCFSLWFSSSLVQYFWVESEGFKIHVDRQWKHTSLLQNYAMLSWAGVSVTMISFRPCSLFWSGKCKLKSHVDKGENNWQWKHTSLPQHYGMLPWASVFSTMVFFEPSTIFSGGKCWLKISLRLGWKLRTVKTH